MSILSLVSTLVTTYIYSIFSSEEVVVNYLVLPTIAFSLKSGYIIARIGTKKFIIGFKLLENLFLMLVSA